MLSGRRVDVRTKSRSLKKRYILIENHLVIGLRFGFRISLYIIGKNELLQYRIAVIMYALRSHIFLLYGEKV